MFATFIIFSFAQLWLHSSWNVDSNFRENLILQIAPAIRHNWNYT